MKKFTSIKLLIIIGMVWIGTSSVAQVNDTLVVEVSSSLVVKVSADKLPALVQSQAANHLIQKFQQEMATIASQIKPQPSYDITYMQEDYIEVDTLKKVQVFSISKEPGINLINMNRCTLIPRKDPETDNIENSLHIVIYFDKLSDLEDSSIDTVIGRALAMVEKPSRFTKNYYFSNVSEQLKLEKEEQTVTRHMDQIFLNAGIGAALIKNTGMVNIGFSAGINLGSRGRILHKIYINDEMNYVFDDNTSFTINNFLGIGYAYNFSRNPEKPSWFGLEAGFLTNKNSNFFADDTYRLGLVVNPTQNINIKPYLYFENNFEKIYPGIGITFDF